MKPIQSLLNFLSDFYVLRPAKISGSGEGAIGAEYFLPFFGLGSGEFKEEHPLKTKEALVKYGLEVPASVVEIIRAHAPSLTGVQSQGKAQWALFCADSLTGLIIATALIYPSKKLAEVKISSVVKRFLREPKFAAGTRREEVKMCERPDGLNIPLEKFIEICLTAMQGVAAEIGL